MDGWPVEQSMATEKEPNSPSGGDMEIGSERTAIRKATSRNTFFGFILSVIS